MNRQIEIENAARRIILLKELINRNRITEKLAELDKETAWKRKENQTESDNLGNEILARSLKYFAETSIEITELCEKLKNNKAYNLVKIAEGLKDVENTLLDFKKKDDDVFFEINSKLDAIKDLRIGIRDDINWKKINELNKLVNLLEEAKLMIINIQIDEEPQWPFKNVD